MVELLEPGTEAETCYMTGRGMNGLKGVIVCYNPNNHRYTLELGKGDMMSLKIRNVRKFGPNKDNDEGLENANNNDPKASSTTSTRDEGNSDSSLPSFPRVSKVEDDDKVQDTFEKHHIMGDIFEMISPVNVILVMLMLAAYSFLKSNISSGVPFTAASTVNTIQYHNIYNEVSLPVMITFALFSFWRGNGAPNSVVVLVEISNGQI